MHESCSYTQENWYYMHLHKGTPWKAIYGKLSYKKRNNLLMEVEKADTIILHYLLYDTF